MRGAACAAAVLVGLVLAAAPASADEFEVGILLGSASDGSFMEGFQLAVDQSPDVSHPDGVEGGDHLGSMDVVLVVVQGLSSTDELVAATTELVGTGLAVIVADLTAEELAAVFEPITQSETMLIAMSGAEGMPVDATQFFFSAGETGGADALLVDRTPTFEAAFVASYGEPPSPAAIRGYLAGRLVDIAVEATDRDPFDEETFRAALSAATSSAVSSPQPLEPEADSSSRSGWWIAVAVTAGALVLLLVARRRR